MPSEPTIFDNEEGLEPHHDRAQSTRAQSDVRGSGARGSDTPNGGRRGPNYLFRRAVLVGGVVAVLATASIVIGQLIGSGSDTPNTGAIGTEWNRVVLVDDRTGRVIVDDDNGEELARFESGVRNPAASALVDPTLVVAGPDRVAVIDTGSDGNGDATEDNDNSTDSNGTGDVDGGAEAIVRPAGSALTMIAPRPDGGRALLVHGPSGDVIDTDTFAPVAGARYEFDDSRSSPSGRDVLVTDSGNFQSVLFSFDRDEPSFFPGLALAVDDDLVVTAQNVGSDATINVFDHAGEPISTGRTASVRAGMITEGGVVLVTAQGGVVTMSAADGDISDNDQLDIGSVESGAVTTTGDRLIVTGATGTAIVGERAQVIANFASQRLAAGQPSPAGSTCLAMIGDLAETQIAVVDVTDGSVLVEASGDEPLLADASGCTVAVATPDGFDVLSRDGVQQFRTGDTALAVSLDGRVVAAERDGRVVLLDVGDDADSSEDPTDLGPQGRTVHFAQS